MKKQKFYWHHPAWFALVLVNIIIYAVVAMIVRRSAEVSYGLCATHKRQRRRGVFIVVGGLFLSFGLIVVGIASDLALLIPIAILGFLVSILIGIVRGRTLLPVRIDKSGARFRGCGEAYLTSLPSS